MDLKEALLQVVYIIAIIVVGGFLVFFLGDLMLAILDPDNTRSARRKREAAEKQKKYEYENEVHAIEAQPQQKYIEEDTSVRDIDEAKAKEQEKMLNDELTSHFERLRAEEEAFRQERLKFAQEKEDLFKKMNSENKSEEVLDNKTEETVENKEDDTTTENNLDDFFFNDDDDDDFNLDDLDFSDINKAVAATENEENADSETHEEEVQEAQEQVEQVEEELDEGDRAEIIDEDEDDDLFKALFEDDEELEAIPVEQAIEEVKDEEMDEVDKSYIEQLKKELQEQKDEVARIKEELAKEKEAAEKLKAEAEEEKKRLEEQLLIQREEPKLSMTLEEYEERLLILKDRLKANDKEFKLNKKEFLPLRKVKRSLDNDKQKLRRREALVAKQKVVLYGVNNYVDIDEEKAKKLAEDLDLLDGLRLSVQHCEEVMKNNSERYPILEQTFEILKANNENLKADILEVEKSIELLKNSKPE